MAGASLFALIDDIATLLDDVAILSKVAVQKTAGVLGDDLALNAQQLTGVDAKRELPVIWAVAKGSAWNKAILVPAALVLSTLLPQLVTPLLMIGGAYLCFEGCEKLVHKFLHRHELPDEHARLAAATADPSVDMVAFEKDKIAGAVRTDFVLSAEIIVIALGTVKDVPLVQRIGVLIAIALVMTVGVYGLVAGIIKLDDLGFALAKRPTKLGRAAGRSILWLAPYLLKTLSIVGTAAMFIVGGGILTHGIDAVHHLFHDWSAALGELPYVGGVLEPLASMTLDAAFGIVVGLVAVALWSLIKGFWPASPAARDEYDTFAIEHRDFVATAAKRWKTLAIASTVWRRWLCAVQRTNYHINKFTNQLIA